MNSSNKRLLPWLCWHVRPPTPPAGWFYCCYYYYFVGTEFFFLAFVNKQNFKHLREIHISGRKRRGQSWLGFLGFLVSLEGALGRFFHFNWWCGFFLVLHRQSLWPAWGLRNQGPSCLWGEKINFPFAVCLLVCFCFPFDLFCLFVFASVIHLKARLGNVVWNLSHPPRYSFATPPWDSLGPLSSQRDPDGLWALRERSQRN